MIQQEEDESGNAKGKNITCWYVNLVCTKQCFEHLGNYKSVFLMSEEDKDHRARKRA